MYNKEELLKKIEGHIKENEIKLLNSLIDDLDEFNKKYADRFIEVYIDFDDVGNDSEWDTYETFSLRIKPTFDSKQTYKEGNNIHSGMSLDELDTACCVLEQYFEEKDDIVKEVEESLKNDNEKLATRILDEYKSGNIIYKDMEGLKIAKLDTFTRQLIDGQLYDLNRLQEVILSLKDEDISRYHQAWINDMALMHLCKYYYNKCANLEAELRRAEDKIITNQIMK